MVKAKDIHFEIVDNIKSASRFNVTGLEESLREKSIDKKKKIAANDWVLNPSNANLFNRGWLGERGCEE